MNAISNILFWTVLCSRTDDKDEYFTFPWFLIVEQTFAYLLSPREEKTNLLIEKIEKLVYVVHVFVLFYQSVFIGL